LAHADYFGQLATLVVGRADARSGYLVDYENADSMIGHISQVGANWREPATNTAVTVI
jgi:hypothetical protein